MEFPLRLATCPHCHATKISTELAPHCETCEVFMTSAPMTGEIGERIEIDGVTHIVIKTRGHAFTSVQTIDETMPEREWLDRSTISPQDPTRTIWDTKHDEAFRSGLSTDQE